MAAEALMRGSETAVVARLREIAGALHWRNVFLFAVGKCFAENEHLLDHVQAICDQLNDKGEEPQSSVALWGSRIALDILEDQVARQNPRYERQFTTTALKLLLIADPMAHVRLADIYHDSLEDLFKQVVRDRLRHGQWGQQMASWRLLVGLANRSIPWALAMVQKFWPANPDFQRDIIECNPLREVQSWELEHLVDLVPACEPERLTTLAKRRDIKSIERRLIPDWLSAAIQWFELSPDLQAPVVAIGGGNWQYLFGITTFSSKKWAAMEALQGMPCPVSGWQPLISASRFACCPSAQSLAVELGRLAETWKPTETRSILARLPWPLGQCVAAAGTVAKICELEALCREGSLGDVSDWENAERRWSADGVRLADFDEQSAFGLIPCSTMNDVGFAFPCAQVFDYVGNDCGSQAYQSGWWHDEYQCLYAFDEAFAKFYRGLAHGKLRCWIARRFVIAQYESAASLFSIVELRELISEALEYEGFTPSFVNHPYGNIGDRAVWMEFLAWLGDTRRDLWGFFSGKIEALDQVCQSYREEPLKFQGLVSVLAAAVVVGNRCDIPDTLLDQCDQEDPVRLFQSMLIRLARPGWDDAKAIEMARWFGGWPVPENRVQLVCQTLEKSNVDLGPAIMFARELYEEIQECFADRHEDLNRIITLLISLLNKRESRLLQPGQWDRLGLPRIVEIEAQESH